jgi:polysaccharide biosynthesis/export protein
VIHRNTSEEFEAIVEMGKIEAEAASGVTAGKWGPTAGFRLRVARNSTKTPVQLTEEISTGLRAYMESPTISIMVKEVNSYQIYVLGEVNKPGKYPLKSKTTLLQGITVAGGFTAMAARNKIVIFRFSKDGEGLTKLKASYDDIVVRDGSSQNMELKPGDQIVVPSETMVVLPTR